jgi:hypothetical protein
MLSLKFTLVDTRPSVALDDDSARIAVIAPDFTLTSTPKKIGITGPKKRKHQRLNTEIVELSLQLRGGTKGQHISTNSSSLLKAMFLTCV